MPRADLRRATRERAALSVAESEARHRALVSALPDGVLLADAEGLVLLANGRAGELLGRGGTTAMPDGAAGTPDGGSAMPDELAAITAQVLRTGEAQHAVAVPITRDGVTVLLNVTVVPLLGDDQRPHAVVTSFAEATTTPVPTGLNGLNGLNGLIGLIGTDPEPADQPGPASTTESVPQPEPNQADITRRGADMFRQSMQSSPAGMAVTALNGRFLRVNRTLCRMFGYRSDELQERTLFEVLHPADVEETSVAIGAMLRGEQDTVTLERRFLGQHDMQLSGLLSITMIRDSKSRPLQLVLQIADRSELQKAQDLVTEMMLHDPLTGLANRTLVLDRIQKSLERSRYGDRKVAVLHCDVDHFKLINDGAGYLQGDAVLVEIGRRVSRALMAGDSAGRLGGDEFVVVCTEVGDEAAAVAVAERLQQSINTPLTIGERTLIPTVSVGIAISSTPDDDPLTLLQDADIATYRAKELGRNRWDLMDGALRRRALDRLDLEQALRHGIKAGELELHFQPIVDVSTRAVVGREALVRWNHPQRGLLSPMLFLPMAEKSGLIIELGDWVLGAATKAAATAQDTDGYVAVNVSPNQVSRPGLAQSVQKALAEAGLPAERLVIELTESVMLSAAPSAREEIERLASLGVRIVVDDFGTGFSALSYLRDLPVSGIKVDRSFTAGLGTDTQCDRIVEALTGLGHGLGMDVIVEGVETEQQRAIVAAIGAEHAQGYLFGRPNPIFDLAVTETDPDPASAERVCAERAGTAAEPQP